MNELPDTLHELLDIAIKDLKACYKSEDYEIDMSLWFSPEIDGVCKVCMAGSVMAKTLSSEPEAESLGEVWNGYGEKLMIIDDLRIGAVEAAHHRLTGKHLAGEMSRKVQDMGEDFTSFNVFDEENKDAFFAQMEDLQEFLSKHNL